jgi:diguanylate cyclase (GGDEF)-like protein
LETLSQLQPKINWRWALIGALFGFFVLHPGAMFTARLMFQSQHFPNDTFNEIIISEMRKAFSIQMLPWSLSFAIISAIAGAFYRRSQQIAAELRKSEQKFRELSITDDLTRLYNSRHFYHQIKREIERTNRYEHPLSLLIIDLDNIKKYNDAFGHIVGDRVLAKAGEILRNSLRKTDTAYRYGGEEFAVLLPETKGEEALHFAERIRQAFENKDLTLQKEQNFSVTVSIGVAQYESGEELNTFIKRTDTNMYAAKNKGKNRIKFS